MKNAKKTIKRNLQLLYTAYHDRRYDRYYRNWLGRHSDDSGPRQKNGEFQRQPLISIVVPTYNTEKKFFSEMIASVYKQVYENWELILVDDCSPEPGVRELTADHAARDARVRYKFLRKNLGISGATNQAIKFSTGEFVALLDHDDILHAEALYEVVAAINQGNYDFIYSDEDKITEGKRGRHQPFCKPAWNNEFLRSVNYITHFTVIRKSLLDKVGYENGRYNGAQDWELFLRCTKGVPENKIHHIPKVLYSWRVHSGSTAKDLAIKPYVFEAQKRAIEDDLKAQGVDNALVLPDETYPGQWQVKRVPKGRPRVSIFVDSRVQKSLLKEIIAKTSYRYYETVIINKNVNITQALNKAEGEYAVFVSEKLRIKNTEWIQDMLGDAQRQDIGFVQARLKRKQDVAKNIESLLAPDQAKLINALTRRNVAKHLYTTARYNLPKLHGGVTMVQVSKLKKVLRSDVHVEVTKWSSELHERGYQNLYNPYIEVLK